MKLIFEGKTLVFFFSFVRREMFVAVACFNQLLNLICCCIVKLFILHPLRFIFHNQEHKIKERKNVSLFFLVFASYSQTFKVSVTFWKGECGEVSRRRGWLLIASLFPRSITITDLVGVSSIFTGCFVFGILCQIRLSLSWGIWVGQVVVVQ